MKQHPRWIKSVQAEAASCEIRMPWERGLRRAAMIARRTETEAAKPIPMKASA